MCALDRLQNKYLRLENRSPRFIQSAHYRKLLCQNPGEDPTQGSPSSPTDLHKGCAIFYVIIYFFIIINIIIICFCCGHYRWQSSFFPFLDTGFLPVRFHSEAEGAKSCVRSGL